MMARRCGATQWSPTSLAMPGTGLAFVRHRERIAHLSGADLIGTGLGASGALALRYAGPLRIGLPLPAIALALYAVAAGCWRGDSKSPGCASVA
jgi:hypothetical protein